MAKARRTGTYVAFHANGKTEPTESDIKYYNLLKAWHVRKGSDFEFVNSHDKTASVRDSSKKETLETSLKHRLLRSKHMILIIGKTTKEDTDWVPFEIRYAVDECSIPIIATYTGFNNIMAPAQLSDLWPAALKTRIDNGTAHVIHIPFKQSPLTDAVGQFDHTTYPKGGGLGYYNRETYGKWGLL